MLGTSLSKSAANQYTKILLSFGYMSKRNKKVIAELQKNKNKKKNNLHIILTFETLVGALMSGLVYTFI